MLERKEKRKRKISSQTIRLVYVLCFVILILTTVLISFVQEGSQSNQKLDMTRTRIARGNPTTYWQLATIDARQTLEWQATQTANATP